jgi:hypothetical protein
VPSTVDNNSRTRVGRVVRWLLVAPVALLGVVAIMAGVGVILPREHTAGRTLTLHHTPQQAWAALMDATSASDVPVDVLESDAPRRHVTRVKPSETMFGGTWTMTITPQQAGATVNITEEGWVQQPVFRFISRYILGHHATMDGILKQVAAKLGDDAILSGE